MKECALEEGYLTAMQAETDSGAKRVTGTIILVCLPQTCNQRAEALPCASHNARRVYYYYYSIARAINDCKGANSLSSEAR